MYLEKVPSFRTFVEETKVYESGYKTASLVYGANYNATMAKKQLSDVNAVSKMDRANEINLDVITHTINSTFPNMTLHFLETNSYGMCYSVVFVFKNAKYVNSDKIVMGGTLTLYSKEKSSGYIEYNFKDGKFYRVSFGKTARRIYELEVDEDYKADANNFITYMQNMLDENQRLKNVVDKNGPTLSKKH